MPGRAILTCAYLAIAILWQVVLWRLWPNPGMGSLGVFYIVWPLLALSGLGLWHILDGPAPGLRFCIATAAMLALTLVLHPQG